MRIIKLYLPLRVISQVLMNIDVDSGDNKIFQEKDFSIN